MAYQCSWIISCLSHHCKSRDYIESTAGRDAGFHSFPHRIGCKMKIIARPEFELASYATTTRLFFNKNRS